MELWQEITLDSVLSGAVKLVLTKEYAEVLESKCYRALTMIRDIIRDDTLNDEECFVKIEEIVSVLDQLGSNGGLRHDFG